VRADADRSTGTGLPKPPRHRRTLH
jgi:hypothetical protein